MCTQNKPLHAIIMYVGPHTAVCTDLLSGKSKFIDMYDIDLPDESAVCFIFLLCMA